MKDTLAIGVIAGLVGGLVGIVFSHAMFLLGINPMSSLHLAAALVVNDIFSLTPGGVFWSIVTHHVVAAVFGVFLALLLLYSGKDYWLPKVVAAGTFVCIVLHAFLMPILRPDIDFRPNAAAFGTMIVTHALIGVIAGWIIVKYYRPELRSR